MQVDITPQEVAETLSMVSEQNLDLRTITMGISLAGCADEDMGRMCDKVYDRITTTARISYRPQTTCRTSTAFPSRTSASR